MNLLCEKGKIFCNKFIFAVQINGNTTTFFLKNVKFIYFMKKSDKILDKTFLKYIYKKRNVIFSKSF